MTSRKLHFQSSARIIKILGEHLIRDNTVGVLELIKNCYDADATSVEIELNNLKDEEKTEITIKDNGDGMTPEIIEKDWFMLAGFGKEEFKETKKKTPLGRIPLGEKGVGRFAAQKIGENFQLVTRPKSSKKEYIFEIDWDDFNEKGKVLEEIPVEIQEKDPEIFSGNAHGTYLKMTGSREPWKKHDLVKLQTALIRLFSPGLEKTNSASNFKITLQCKEFPEIENLKKVDILKKFQYSIDCNIDEKGRAKYVFRIRSPENKIEETIEEEVNLWSRINPDSWISEALGCGPFRVRIFTWMLTASNLEKYGLTRSHLKDLSGVSIFRNTFRLLPYGDVGDDWLGLDNRRINNPSKFFSNNQCIGIVDITEETNPELKDKTNREGLWENNTFREFRELVLAVLSELETKSFQHRNKMNKPKKEEKPKSEDIQKELTQMKEEIVKLQKNQAEIQEDIPDEIVEEIKKDNIIVPKEEYNTLVKSSDYLEKSFEEFAGTQDTNKESFYHLCSMGIAAERFVHEFDRLLSLCEKELKELEKAGRNESSKKIAYALNALKNELELIATLKFVSSDEKKERTSAQDLVEEILALYKLDFDEAGIKVSQEGSNFEASIKKSSLGQVFDNILNNAVYWLKQKTLKTDRKIKIKYSKEHQSVEIINNGPPIPPEIQEKLFKQPFVTAKPHGRGLGLFLSNKIMELNGGKIHSFNTDGKTHFSVTFPMSESR